MPDLQVSIENIVPAKHAAAPLLSFKLAITQRGAAVAIQNIALQCQIRIDTSKRSYTAGEQECLTDLFGEPSRWSQTLHSMLWTQATVIVPAFAAQHTHIDLPVPCSFDFNVAATKYFHGLEDGEVPLLLLFSGSVFYRDADGALAMDLISWNEEARYGLPVAVWQDMMALYYPNQAWLSVNRRVFAALYAYKRQHGYTGFDEALTSLLPKPVRAAS